MRAVWISMLVVLVSAHAPARAGGRLLGASASCTRVHPDEFRLDTCGVALGLRDRVEISISRQEFDLGDVVPGESIRQTTVGVKLRVLGDAVYDQHR